MMPGSRIGYRLHKFLLYIGRYTHYDLCNPVMPVITSICVYCGSRVGASPTYTEAARELGTTIAQRGLKLVYGGARVGLMGELANAALAAGGTVIGVIPQSLVEAEVAHEQLAEQWIVADMHARKLAMSRAADAFVALPGGLGTLEELFEILTWRQLGWHTKPIGVLDLDDFYAPLRAHFKQMVDAGFVPPEQYERLIMACEPSVLLDLLLARHQNG